jgi:hypothetical protein
MGLTKPLARLPRNVQDEIKLARAVDEAVVKVQPAVQPDATEEGTAAAVERIVAELDGAVSSAALSGGTPTSLTIPQLTLPIVFLDGLEVTQEVQDLAHSVPLVAGKTTIVRAYLRYPPSAVSVRGELRIARSPFGPWRTISSLNVAVLDPSRSGGTLAQLRSRRANLDYSLNFMLPDDMIGQGTLWLRMGGIRRATGTPLPSLAGLTIRTVTFDQAVPLRMRLVRLRYTMGNPPVTHEPSATDVAFIGSWLRRAYPISRLDLTTTVTTATPAPEFDAAQINAQLIAIRAVDVSTGTDARTHYYGMVADSGFFMRGLASDIPQTPQPGTVASGPTGPSGFSWDTDGSYGDWYGGHELGHTVGRFHAEFCGAVGGAPYPFPNGQLSDADEAFVGIDVGDPALGLPMRIMGGITSHDVMSYCDNQWLSSFTYRGIYDRLVAEDALPAGAGGPAPAPARTTADGADVSGMRVIGALNLTRTSGGITTVLPAADDGQTLAAGAQPYDVRVRVRGEDGEILDERAVPFVRSAIEDPDADVTGVVDATLPYVDGAAELELLVDGQVVDRHPVGGEVAAVGAPMRTDSAGLGADASGGPVELRWDAPDAPPGQRYIVQLSDDGGTSWRTIAVGLAEPAITIPTDDLAADEVMVRILATTGTGTTVVRTDSVRLR